MVTPRRPQDRPPSRPRTTGRTRYRPRPDSGRVGLSWLGPAAVIVVLGVLVLAAMPGLWPRDAAGGQVALGASPTSTIPRSTGAGSGQGPSATEDVPAPTQAPATTDQALPDPTHDPARTHPDPIVAAQRRLDNAFAAMAREVGAPGLAAAVELSDGSVWYGAAGVLWPDGPAVTPDTPFAWGSITKTFVAALALRLASQGGLDLDATLDTWFPDFPQARRITLRMLLAHRSGIFDYFQHPDYAARVFDHPLHAWTPDEILSLTGRRTNAPGKAFSYSNTNYVLLGLVLEQVTGKPLADQVHDELLAPLGLDETVFQQAGRPVGLVGAKGFWKDGTGFREWSDGSDFRPTTSAATVAWAAGAMEGSVRDLLDWEMSLYEGDVLTPDALGQMLAFDPKSGYGLGARTQTLAQRQGYGHGGSLRGFVSVMYRLPVEDVDVVVLTNVGFADLDRVASRLARAAINALATPAPSVSVPPPSGDMLELQGDTQP